MREQWARTIVYLTGIIVIILAVYFASIQNPSIPVKTEETAKPLKTTIVSDDNKKRIEQGQKIYEQEACAMCHAINGKGNPRYPLDGVGERLSKQELRDWVVGGDSIKALISESVFQYKQKHKKLAEDDLEALIFYLNHTGSETGNE